MGIRETPKSSGGKDPATWPVYPRGVASKATETHSLRPLSKVARDHLFSPIDKSLQSQYSQSQCEIQAFIKVKMKTIRPTFELRKNTPYGLRNLLVMSVVLMRQNEIHHAKILFNPKITRTSPAVQCSVRCLGVPSRLGRPLSDSLVALGVN